MITLTITATSMADAVAQMRNFIGEPDAPAVAAPVKPAGRAVPAWAPAGSSWVAMPGAPALVGPDGAPVPVQWINGAPTPGTITHFHDPEAEAAGEALMKVINP